MPRKRRIPKGRTKLEISPALWAWLNDERTGERDSETKFEILALERSHRNAKNGSEDKLLTLWLAVRDELLARWYVDHPGSRPGFWWVLEAPRQPKGDGSCRYEGTLPEPRHRVGGTGVTAWDRGLAIVPCFSFGLPTAWSTFDENAPPRFESEAAYLDRHGLLTPAEKKRLKSAAFQPVCAPMDVLIYGEE
jgi:hypothetical protein